MKPLFLGLAVACISSVWAQTEILNVDPEVTAEVRDVIAYDTFMRQEQEAPPENGYEFYESEESDEAQYQEEGENPENRQAEEEFIY